MAYFEIQRWNRETGTKVLGLIESPNSKAALQLMREAGLPTESSGDPDTVFSLSSPPGGYTSPQQAREDAAGWNASAVHPAKPRITDLSVVGTGELHTLINA